LVRVAEITICESIEKPETGNAIEWPWHSENAHDCEVPAEAKRGKMDTESIGRIGAGISAPQNNVGDRDATTKEAIPLLKNKVNASSMRTRARIGKEGTSKRVATLSQGQADLQAWPTMPERPLHAWHQWKLQISITSS
jgi:hypothetical protein